MIECVGTRELVLDSKTLSQENGDTDSQENGDTDSHENGDTDSQKGVRSSSPLLTSQPHSHKDHKCLSLKGWPCPRQGVEKDTATLISYKSRLPIGFRQKKLCTGPP